MERGTKACTFLLITMGRPSLIPFQKPIRTRSPSVSRITRISQHCSQNSAASIWNCYGVERPIFSLKGGGFIMEETLMYLTGNDSRLAQYLISALSRLFISFFSAKTEDENEAEPINPIQDTGGAPGQGSPCLFSITQFIRSSSGCSMYKSY